MKGVRKWGKQFYIYKNDEKEKEMTHLCLDGGKLHVPFDDVNYLNTKLGADVARGIRNYIVERRTPIFKFHADLDIFEPRIKDYSEIKAWITNDILEVLRQFYPQFVHDDYKKLTVIICTTEGKVGVEKYGTLYDKVGVHLLFPLLLTTTEQSMKLRSGFIQWFTTKFGERNEGYNEWADLFDKTVYLSNGLRMVGCSKTERCKVCKGTPSDEPPICIKCNGKGKNDIGRIYIPQDVVNGDGADDIELLEELLEDEIFMVKTTSIRCDPRLITSSDVPIQTIPTWYDPTKDVELIEKKRNPISRTVKIEGGSGSSKFEKSISTEVQNTRIRLSNTDLRLNKIVQWFKNNELHELFSIPKQYRCAVIQDVVMYTPSAVDRYYLINVDSRWCMNIQNEHKNNGVYFVLNQIGLIQKCFCRCATTDGRVSGLRCEEYSSDIVEIPDDLVKLLFSFDQDKRKDNYLKFVDHCNSSLSNIKDERKLLDTLLDSFFH